MTSTDLRTWLATDHPGERIAIGSPLKDVEVMSVTGSQRAWGEPLHERFTVAAVARAQPRIRASWHTRSRSLTTHNGQLMCINAGDGHLTSQVSGPAAFDVVKLSTQLITDARQGLGLPCRFWFRSPAAEEPAVFDALQRFVRSIAEGEDGLVRESALADVVSTIVTQLAESESPSGIALGPVRDYRLRRVAEILQDAVRSENVQKPTLGDLAREANLCRFRLCTVFKRTYGAPIGQYWTRCRVDRAKRLLVRGTPIVKVAHDMAFADESQFSRMFKKYVGLPPARWRDVYLSNSRSLQR